MFVKFCRKIKNCQFYEFFEHPRKFNFTVYRKFSGEFWYFGFV
jgi:hypothetical protein